MLRLIVFEFLFCEGFLSPYFIEKYWVIKSLQWNLSHYEDSHRLEPLEKGYVNAIHHLNRVLPIGTNHISKIYDRFGRSGCRQYRVKLLLVDGERALF